MRDALAHCGADALREMIASGEDAAVSCQFCDAEYAFSPAELEEILAQTEAAE